MTEAPFLLVLIAHGSRDPRWRAPFEALRESIQLQVLAQKKEACVALCYMEMAQPDLSTAVREALQQQPSIKEARILPLLMAAGAHFANEIQEQTHALKQQFPQLHIELLPPAGEAPGVKAALQQLALEALRA